MNVQVSDSVIREKKAQSDRKNPGVNLQVSDR